ncbi:cellulosomal protein [Enhygromyxa salina]|uniref:Cellulosomal protein n=1 Tax=Enhygromyxa salina TaxID=215803 RepID=A0A0C2D524_9BACT|nr:cellulosomal protein [Enhygromyxa salina]
MYSTRSLVFLSLGAILACSGSDADQPSANTFEGVSASDTATSDLDGTETESRPATTDSGDPDDSAEPDPTDETEETDGGGPALPPNEQIPPTDEEGCHGIYAQDLLPTFNLTIDPLVWDLLKYEWNNGEAIEEMGEDPKGYHPLEAFTYGDVVINNAKIRLRGNATYWDPIPGDKMQFQIGFHTNDENGNFLGIKRLALDSATYNEHMLRDRLALAVMRDAGVPAPCANNARVVVNGEYYGIFTNIEKIDEVFLERVFDDPTGDLWKRANWELKTNTDTSNDDRLDDLKDAEDPEELFTYLDIEQALRAFASEAVIPDSDGMWAGGLNFYVYDEPISGKFMMLPWDLDNTFERFNDKPNGEYPENPDPIVWEKWTTHGRPFYEIALEDPMWFARYIELIDEITHEAYTPQEMHERIDTWTAQIQTAVLEDTNKPWSNEDYIDEVEDLHEYVQARFEFLEEWLECWKNGGVNDGDGYCEEP